MPRVIGRSIERDVESQSSHSTSRNTDKGNNRAQPPKQQQQQQQSSSPRPSPKKGKKDLPSVAVYLRERGLNKYTDSILAYGIESVGDLEDRDIIDTAELRDEIRMTKADIAAFYGPPGRLGGEGDPRGGNNATHIEVETGHVSSKRLEKLRRASVSGWGGPAGEPVPHEGHASLAVFIRSLKQGLHFLRMAGTGKLVKTTVTMRSGNVGIKYFLGGGKKVALDFKHLCCVVDLAHAPHWTPDQVAVEAIMKDPSYPAKALMLVFKRPDDDDDGDDGGGEDRRRRSSRDEFGDLPQVEEGETAFEDEQRAGAFNEKQRTARGNGGQRDVMQQRPPHARTNRRSSVGDGAVSGGGGWSGANGGVTSFWNVGSIVGGAGATGSGKHKGGGSSSRTRAVQQQKEATRALLAFATAQVGSAVAVGSAPRSSVLSGQSQGDLVHGGGIDVVLLVAGSVESKAVAVRGFSGAMKHSRHHAGTHARMEEERAAEKWKRPLTFDVHNRAGQLLCHLHHIYRPHHHHNHPPARFHNGIVAEVQYDDLTPGKGPSYRIEVDPNPPAAASAWGWSCWFNGGSDGETATGAGAVRPERRLKRLKLPNPLFDKGMYLRAKIIDYNRETATYDLEYLDGPYLGDESPDKHHQALSLSTMPKAKFLLKGVNGAFISVDLVDNYGSHTPVFILFVSFVQVLCFCYYVYYVLDDGASQLSGSDPVAGPSKWWMRVIGEWESDTAGGGGGSGSGQGCEDLRWQWWRLWTYQLVHAGTSHIGNNVVMQIIFGLPINMVHGNLRMLTMYELGVLGGSLNFVVAGGGQTALVGASGGVYSIFGIHFAELLMNWSNEVKGYLNHWTRLLLMSAIIGYDFYLYYSSRSHTTSYTAHVGGFLTGFVVAIVTLENLEVSWYERWLIIPAAYVAALVALAVTANVYRHFPPDAYLFPVAEDSCCVQALTCDGLRPNDFSRMTCIDYTTLTRANGRTVLDDCAAFNAYVDE